MRILKDSLLCRQIPPAHSNDTDDCRHADGVIHIACGDRFDRWEEQHHTYEEHPRHGDQIDRLAPATHCVWSRDEGNAMLVDSVRYDDGDIAEVEGGRCDAEDAVDSLW